MATWSLTDQFGRPISKDVLISEMAGPTLTGVRQPLGTYPGDGLTPERLAAIMRAADQGNPFDYYDLAEQIEERDGHYLGVLGTRKRIVAQTPVRVEAASDDPAHVRHADMVRAWLQTGVLRLALFDMLDAIGKGASYNEIVWEVSEGQWTPAKIIHRPQRWFMPDPINLETPLLRDGAAGTPLPWGKFIVPRIVAKSGLTTRSGLARVAAWGWMFKAYADKDWAIFVQTYGQPIRLGKYPSGASEDAKRRLFQAVANIASDCAAIIEQGTDITFVESNTTDKSAANYKARIDHIDQQISKAVLGQTATTDAIAGGHAVGREHRQVQQDIATADREALAACLTDQLIRPWINLEFGPQKAYPRLVIEEPDETDIPIMADALAKLVPLGLKVSMAEVRDKLGLSDPDPDEEVLATGGGQPLNLDQITGTLPAPAALPTGSTALHTALPPPRDMVDRMAAAAESLAQPAMDELIGAVRGLVQSAVTLEDVRDGLLALYPKLSDTALAEAMQKALIFAELAGRADDNPDA